MTTLNIKDLSHNEELSGKEMANVRGGNRLFVDINKETIKQFADAKASQENNNLLDITIQNATNNALLGKKSEVYGDVHVDVDVDQDNDFDVTQKART